MPAIKKMRARWAGEEDTAMSTVSRDAGGAAYNDARACTWREAIWHFKCVCDSAHVQRGGVCVGGKHNGGCGLACRDSTWAHLEGGHGRDVGAYATGRHLGKVLSRPFFWPPGQSVSQVSLSCTYPRCLGQVSCTPDRLAWAKLKVSTEWRAWRRTFCFGASLAWCCGGTTVTLRRPRVVQL